jgi:cell division protein FtsB
MFTVEALLRQRSIMPEQEEHEAPALHSELVALRKRIEVLEARVTELEEELRETQETAAAD